MSLIIWPSKKYYELVITALFLSWESFLLKSIYPVKIRTWTPSYLVCFWLVFFFFNLDFKNTFQFLIISSFVLLPSFWISWNILNVSTRGSYILYSSKHLQLWPQTRCLVLFPGSYSYTCHKQFSGHLLDVQQLNQCCHHMPAVSDSTGSILRDWPLTDPQSDVSCKPKLLPAIMINWLKLIGS